MYLHGVMRLKNLDSLFLTRNQNPFIYPKKVNNSHLTNKIP